MNSLTNVNPGKFSALKQRNTGKESFLFSYLEIHAIFGWILSTRNAIAIRYVFCKTVCYYQPLQFKFYVLFSVIQIFFIFYFTSTNAVRYDFQVFFIVHCQLTPIELTFHTYIFIVTWISHQFIFIPTKIDLSSLGYHLVFLERKIEIVPPRVKFENAL